MTTKVRFDDARQARRSLEADRLGCVYRTAGAVFVVTTHGTGEFTPEEWDGSGPGGRKPCAVLEFGKRGPSQE